MVLELSLLCKHSAVCWILRRFVNLNLEEEVYAMMFSHTWNLASQWKQQHAHTESLFLTAGDRNAVHSRLVFPQFFKIAPRKVSFEVKAGRKEGKITFNYLATFQEHFLGTQRQEIIYSGSSYSVRIMWFYQIYLQFLTGKWVVNLHQWQV